MCQKRIFLLWKVEAPCSVRLRREKIGKYKNVSSRERQANGTSLGQTYRRHQRSELPYLCKPYLFFQL